MQEWGQWGKSNECDGEETHPNKQKTSSREIETFEKSISISDISVTPVICIHQPKKKIRFGLSLEDRD